MSEGRQTLARECLPKCIDRQCAYESVADHNLYAKMYAVPAIMRSGISGTSAPGTFSMASTISPLKGASSTRPLLLWCAGLIAERCFDDKRCRRRPFRLDQARFALAALDKARVKAEGIYVKDEIRCGARLDYVRLHETPSPGVCKLRQVGPQARRLA